jgi:hypothetical protein
LERGVRPIGDWSMSMILSSSSSPSMRSCGPGHRAGAHEAARRGFVERLDHQARLAAAGNAGDAGEGAEGELRGDALQVVPRGADNPHRALAVHLAPRVGHGDAAAPGKIIAGEARRVGSHLRRGALRHHAPAAGAGRRADVHQVVGGADRVLVVLHHQHGVAEVAQAPERRQQTLVVALVQADRGLIQHVEHAGEAAADLRGEADALRLAAESVAEERPSER